MIGRSDIIKEWVRTHETKKSWGHLSNWFCWLPRLLLITDHLVTVQHAYSKSAHNWTRCRGSYNMLFTRYSNLSLGPHQSSVLNHSRKFFSNLWQNGLGMDRDDERDAINKYRHPLIPCDDYVFLRRIVEAIVLSSASLPLSLPLSLI